MYESRPYFYREIYEVLKNFTENTFPLRNQLIDIKYYILNAVKQVHFIFITSR